MTDPIRHVLVRPALLALAAFAAVLVAPSAANALTLGSTHVAQSSQGSVFCGQFPNCAYAQTALADATVRAPFDGRIRSFHVHLSDAGSVQLLVLRKRADGSFNAIEGTSVRTTATDGVKQFGANLPIHKGDLVGLNLLDEDVSIEVLNPPGVVRSKGFLPALDIGVPQQPYAPFSSDFDELLFNAQLKH
jgi:hypothetical protein